MRSPGWIVALALVAALTASPALAQHRKTPVFQDRSVDQIGFEYGSYYQEGEEASPSDAPTNAPAANGNGHGNGYCNCQAEEEEEEDECGCEEEEEEEEECPGWKLFDCCWLECRDITIGGWIVQAFTWNPQNPVDRYNGPVTWLDRSNEYQMTRTWLYLEHKADSEQCCCWDLGYRIDAMYGTDQRFISATGLDLDSDFVPQWNRAHRFYGVVVPQFFVEAAKGDWKVQVGRMGSPVGYFSIFTQNNFFNNLPYTYQYGEPFTHTGAHVYYTVCDHLTVSSAFITGWDNFISRDRNAGYLGTVTVTGDGGDSLAWVVVVSDEPNQALQYTPRYFQTLVYQRPINDCWTYVIQSDFGTQSDAVTRNPAAAQSAQWYGINQYLFYKQNDCVTWGLGFEWFRDEDGFRVGGFLLPRPGQGPADRGLPGIDAPAPAAPTARNNYVGSFFQLTFGPQWRPNKNLLIRPNARYDWFDGQALNAGGLRPFNDGKSNNQFTLATDVIFSF